MAHEFGTHSNGIPTADGYPSKTAQFFQKRKTNSRIMPIGNHIIKPLAIADLRLALPIRQIKFLTKFSHYTVRSSPHTAVLIGCHLQVVTQVMPLQWFKDFSKF